MTGTAMRNEEKAACCEKVFGGEEKAVKIEDKTTVTGRMLIKFLEILTANQPV